MQWFSLLHFSMFSTRVHKRAHTMLGKLVEHQTHQHNQRASLVDRSRIEFAAMSQRRVARVFFAFAMMIGSSCASANSYAGKQRAVRAAQWNNEWARGAVFYEIFVRSFSDSN